MPSLALTIPLPPDKAGALRRYLDEVRGRRQAEWHDMLRRTKLTRHSFYLQHTPQGDMLIVYFEGDIAYESQYLATSNHPFDQWVRQQVLETEGVDLSAPYPGPLPEVLLESSIEDVAT